MRLADRGLQVPALVLAGAASTVVAIVLAGGFLVAEITASTRFSGVAAAAGFVLLVALGLLYAWRPRLFGLAG